MAIFFMQNIWNIVNCENLMELTKEDILFMRDAPAIKVAFHCIKLRLAKFRHFLQRFLHNDEMHKDHSANNS